LFRQSVVRRVAESEDVNDAELLRHDPAMRGIVGAKRRRGARLRRVRWDASRRNGSRRPRTSLLLPTCLASGSTLCTAEGHPVASPTYGEQEMSVWNGHYACTCYHPLFVFNQFGDLERCALRAGNVHRADGWDDVLKPVVARYQGKISRIYFRADAALCNARGLRISGGGADQIRYPATGQPDRTICSRAQSDDLRTPEVLVAVSTSRLSCKRAGKTGTLMPVWGSSGESRLSRR